MNLVILKIYAIWAERNSKFCLWKIDVMNYVFIFNNYHFNEYHKYDLIFLTWDTNLMKKKEPAKICGSIKESLQGRKRERGRQRERKRASKVNDERQTNPTPLWGNWLILEKRNPNKKKWSMRWVCNCNYALGFHQKSLLNSSKVNWFYMNSETFIVKFLKYVINGITYSTHWMYWKKFSIQTKLIN